MKQNWNKRGWLCPRCQHVLSRREWEDYSRRHWNAICYYWVRERRMVKGKKHLTKNKKWIQKSDRKHHFKDFVPPMGWYFPEPPLEEEE